MPESTYNLPQITTYNFTEMYNPGVSISIEAHSFVQAMEKLVETVKHPADFKLK